MNKQSERKWRAALVVAGPTASGKSDLAIRLAETFGGIVINADSMQLYRELRILTARPGAAAEARAPHRLYGILPAAEAGSAAAWRARALAEIEAAWATGRLPILVGGTGLYLQTLYRGLAPVPAIPPSVVAEATALHAELGPEGFHRALAARDPEMAARLRPSDRQRLVRAFSVVVATGRSLAAWQAVPPREPAFGAPLATIHLDPPRAETYARCDTRFAAMVAEGALEEVAALLALDLDPGLPAVKAVGVAPLGRHLRGETTLDEAIAAGQQATRRYAKRQMTWFRHRLALSSPQNAQFSESFSPEIFSFIRQFLLTAP